MARVTIRGVEVQFPFEPYSVQKDYMEKVIEALQLQHHAVLESPTGTGKTLSLLCSTLAWVLSQNRGNPEGPASNPDGDSTLGMNWAARPMKKRVIYASRTHGQLSKAMKELQTTAYKTVKITLLGSRDQLCIHPIVSKETSLSAKNAMCSMQVKKKTCEFNNKVESMKKDPALIKGIVDIEDLVTFGKNRKCCPYYLARELQDSAEIVFMPYNYLVDLQIRRKLNIYLHNTVVILDEGHNVDKVCEESSSVTITNLDIAVALQDITKEMTDFDDEGDEEYPVEKLYTKEDLCLVKETFLALENAIDSVSFNNQGDSITYPGSYVFKILSEAKISNDSYDSLMTILNSLHEVLQYKEGGTGRRGGAIGKISDALEIFFSIDPKSADAYFKTHFTKATNNREMNFWCFHPGLGMSGILRSGVHSLILTSGTLAPISATIQEFEFQHPVVLESPHIVDQAQVCVTIVTKGPNNVDLSSSYQNRDNVNYWIATGLTLQNFMRLVPDGVLVFFPSYAALNKAVSTWKSNGLWAKLIMIKPIFVEEVNRWRVGNVMEDYKKAVMDGSGGVLMGVCRGKVAEGMDFSDNFGRAVLIFGLPYPPIYDPKVKLKKAYVDSRKLPGLTGELWYQLEATKAVNQAIGRVIRHINDFGMIILCDLKFTQPNVIKNLSKWIQPIVKKSKNFGEAMCILRNFFRLNLEQRMAPIQAHIQSVGASNVPSGSSSHQGTTFSELPVFQGPDSGGNDNLNSLLAAVGKRKGAPTASCLAAIKQAEEDAENAKKFKHPKSVTSLGDFNREIKSPAKLRKESVVQVLVGEIKATSHDPSQIMKAKKLNDAKNFVCELRNTLEDESYAQFDVLIREYHKNNDINYLISKLTILFPAGDPYLRDLFLDCKKMLRGKEEEIFIQYCDKHYQEDPKK